MKMKFSVMAATVILISINSNAKIDAHAKSISRKPVIQNALSEKSLVEELTGKKDYVGTAATRNLKKAPLPMQHYVAGKKAAVQKNYILAIKHFNTILKKYPQSAHVKPALMAKASIYQEMGLKSQSSHNLKMAQQKSQLFARTPKSKQAMKTLEKRKVIK